jgi:hypothetical protein
MAWVTVDVKASDFDDEPLVAELLNRGYVVHDRDAKCEELMPIYEALHLGKQELAIQLMSSYITYKTGRIL